jgi:hypothetical protein
MGKKSRDDECDEGGCTNSAILDEHKRNVNDRSLIYFPLFTEELGRLRSTTFLLSNQALGHERHLSTNVSDRANGGYRKAG